MAKIYDKGPGEKVIICAVREAHIRPFQATDWLDLRVGFFLSLTQAAADDTITALAETITPASWTDRVAIGVTDTVTGQTFMGYTNLPAGRNINAPGVSTVVSSDIGVGTTNTRFWRAVGGVEVTGNSNILAIIDGGQSRARSVNGSQAHYVQDVAGAGGYSTFLGLRFTRPNTSNRANIITMSVKKPASGFTSDILFSSTPTNAIGEAQLESFPTDVQTLGPIEMSHPPDSFYFYWPYHLSRLRIHEVCIVKVA